MLIKGPTPPTRALQNAQSQQNRSLRSLATGKRVDRAADDVAALAIGRRIDAQEVSISQAGRNIADGVSFARIADGGLSSAQSIVGRLRELALQAGNGTLSDGQRGSLQAEAGQLQEELSRIEGTTEFNGQNVFEDGLSVDIQAGGDAGDTLAIEPGGTFVSANGLDSIDLSTAAGAQDALAQLDSATEDLSARQARMGTIENRFSVAGNELESRREGLIAARSRIEDADVAETTAQSVAARIRAQAAVSVHSQAHIAQSMLGSLYQGLG